MITGDDKKDILGRNIDLYPQEILQVVLDKSCAKAQSSIPTLATLSILAGGYIKYHSMNILSDLWDQKPPSSYSPNLEQTGNGNLIKNNTYKKDWKIFQSFL